MESFNNHILMYAPKRSAFRYLTRIYIYHTSTIYVIFIFSFYVTMLIEGKVKVTIMIYTLQYFYSLYLIVLRLTSAGAF